MWSYYIVIRNFNGYVTNITTAPFGLVSIRRMPYRLLTEAYLIRNTNYCLLVLIIYAIITYLSIGEKREKIDVINSVFSTSYTKRPDE